MDIDLYLIVNDTDCDRIAIKYQMPMISIVILIDDLLLLWYWMLFNRCLITTWWWWLLLIVIDIWLLFDTNFYLILIVNDTDLLSDLWFNIDINMIANNTDSHMIVIKLR